MECWSTGVLEYWFLSACITPLFHHSTTPVPLGLPLFSTSLHSHTLMTPNVRANLRRLLPPRFQIENRRIERLGRARGVEIFANERDLAACSA